MIRLFLLFLLAVFLNGANLAEIHLNRNHALVTFVESLSGTAYVSYIPKQVYLEKFTRKSISDLKHIHKRIARSRIFGHKKTKNLLEALYLESVKYDTFEKFKKKMLSFRTTIGKKRLEEYLNEIDDLGYIYDRIIWERSKKDLEYKKNRIEDIMEKTKYNDLILTLGRFYGVDEKELEKIDIALYPIPKRSDIKAFSIKTIETVGIYPKGGKNLNWLLSATILHEISHTIYAKSPFIKKNFTKIKDKEKRRLVNEVFATAIGAGWGYEKLAKKSAVRYPWYNNKEYDRLAKKFYPLLKEYLDNKKQIDEKIVKFVKGELL